jgi:hypothetical protein
MKAFSFVLVLLLSSICGVIYSREARDIIVGQYLEVDMTSDDFHWRRVQEKILALAESFINNNSTRLYRLKLFKIIKAEEQVNSNLLFYIPIVSPL